MGIFGLGSSAGAAESEPSPRPIHPAFRSFSVDMADRVTARVDAECEVRMNRCCEWKEPQHTLHPLFFCALPRAREQPA